MTRKVLVFAAIVFASFEIFACAAVTQKGTQCKRAPVPGSLYCWQHGGKSSSTTSADTGSRLVPNTTTVTHTNGRSDVVVKLPKDERTDEDWTLVKLRFLDNKLRETISKGRNPPQDLSSFKRFTHLSFSDQWGTPFKYDHGADWYTLTSAGADKVFGTEDDISLSYEKQ